jgi:chloramphenicol 3-O phosphotransferase
MAGQIVILNGAPRSGKTSIARAVQESLDGVWVNLGVDCSGAATPERYRPGIGLRPGGEAPGLEPVIVQLYAALYDSIAAHARAGLNVAVDIGHHDSYSRPLDILRDCARRLTGLRVLFVGVRCPIETIMQRRNASGGSYLKGSPDDPAPAPVRLWQTAVHDPGIYDLEVDTSILAPLECADEIRRALSRAAQHPTAFERLAAD